MSNFFNLSSIQISNIILLFITIRIITGSIGINGLGLVMFAYRFSLLAGAVINYGTNQSGVRETVYNLSDGQKLGVVFYNILFIRAIIFVLFAIGIFGFYFFHVDYYSFILLSVPVVLAEVLNPLCFFIGTEKLKIFNGYNLVANVVAALAIFFFVTGPEKAIWVNFILGTGNVITYSGLLFYVVRRYKLSFQWPLKADLLRMGKDNFYLTVNNISANLQQSIIIFALKWNSSALLGAYTLCDRVMSQCRNLLNIIGNAIYPNAVNLYRESTKAWIAYRRKSKQLLTVVFLAGAIVIFILADFIVYILSKQHDQNAIALLRIMAIVPIISASNVINVLDQLIKNSTANLFRISSILLVVSLVAAVLIARFGNYILVGGFTVIIEICALFLSEYFIKKPAVNNA